MTSEKRAALRRLAQAATPGPWTMEANAKCPDVLCADGLIIVNTSGSDMLARCDAGNAAYIAAAHPGAVLALLDALDAAEQQHAAAVAAAERRGIERAAAATIAYGNFGDLQRHELTEDFGQPRYDMMQSIVAAILALPPSDGDALAAAQPAREEGE